VLPVSAVILANLTEYVHTLERSQNHASTKLRRTIRLVEAPATGNDALYFRYSDATDQAFFFLYPALERR